MISVIKKATAIAIISVTISKGSKVPGTPLISCNVSKITATTQVTVITVRLYLPFMVSPKVSLMQKNNEYAHRKSQAKLRIKSGYFKVGNQERKTERALFIYVLSAFVRYINNPIISGTMMFAANRTFLLGNAI